MDDGGLVAHDGQLLEVGQELVAVVCRRRLDRAVGGDVDRRDRPEVGRERAHVDVDGKLVDVVAHLLRDLKAALHEAEAHELDLLGRRQAMDVGDPRERARQELLCVGRVLVAHLRTRVGDRVDAAGEVARESHDLACELERGAWERASRLPRLYQLDRADVDVGLRVHARHRAVVGHDVAERHGSWIVIWQGDCGMWHQRAPFARRAGSFPRLPDSSIRRARPCA